MTINREQFLNDFRAFIEQHYRSGGLSVSTLGHLWKAHAPDTNWQALGFLRMSDALYAITDAEGSEWEVLNRGTPQMILLKRGETLAAGSPSTGERVGSAKGMWVPRLVPDVWLAFVNELRWGKRYLNRHTGEVKSDVEDSPGSAEDWVDVAPIPQPEQQNWAREFLAEMNLTERQDLRAAIEQPQWYLHLAHILRLTPALSGAWNAFRSRRVSDYVQAWCATNGVDVQLLRAPDRSARHKPVTAFSASSVSGTVTLSQPKSELRRILIAAFARLHTHEMLQTTLPPHAVIAVLRPELID